LATLSNTADWELELGRLDYHVGAAQSSSHNDMRCGLFIVKVCLAFCWYTVDFMCMLDGAW